MSKMDFTDINIDIFDSQDTDDSLIQKHRIAQKEEAADSIYAFYLTTDLIPVKPDSYSEEEDQQKYIEDENHRCLYHYDIYAIPTGHMVFQRVSFTEHFNPTENYSRLYFVIPESMFPLLLEKVKEDNRYSVFEKIIELYQIEKEINKDLFEFNIDFYNTWFQKYGERAEFIIDKMFNNFHKHIADLYRLTKEKVKEIYDYTRED